MKLRAALYVRAHDRGGCGVGVLWCGCGCDVHGYDLEEEGVFLHPAHNPTMPCLAVCATDRPLGIFDFDKEGLLCYPHLLAWVVHALALC